MPKHGAGSKLHCSAGGRPRLRDRGEVLPPLGHCRPPRVGASLRFAGRAPPDGLISIIALCFLGPRDNIMEVQWQEEQPPLMRVNPPSAVGAGLRRTSLGVASVRHTSVRWVGRTADARRHKDMYVASHHFHAWTSTAAHPATANDNRSAGTCGRQRQRYAHRPLSLPHPGSMVGDGCSVDTKPASGVHLLAISRRAPHKGPTFAPVSRTLPGASID